MKTTTDIVTVMERWRQVVGYEGFYEVSDQGRIYSQWTHDIVSGAPDKQGYLIIKLYDAKGPTTKKIHRIVLEAFEGPSDLYVLHNDDNPANNTLDNLRYGTQKENQADALSRGRRLTGEAHPNAKLTEAQKHEIANRVSQGENRKLLVEEYGVTNTSITRIIKDARYSVD
jgi:hypothetical protein